MRWDYDEVSAQLLRQLRGRRSQVAFSRRLGYRSNVAYAWETGRRAPTAAAFVAAARTLGVDVSALGTFAASDGDPHVDWSDPGVLAAWLDGLRGTVRNAEIARRSGRHRAAVGRWLAGHAEPRLPDLLRLVDAMTDRLLDFAAVFVDPAEVPILAGPWADLRATRALAGATPWALAVLLALELDAYQALRPAPPGWIGQRLGLPDGVEALCLELLLRAGRIRAVGGGRYAPVWSATVDAPVSAAEARTFWGDEVRRRLTQGAPGVHGWNLGVVSTADRLRLEALQRHTFRELRGIVAASAPAEEVVVISWALGALGPAEP